MSDLKPCPFCGGHAGSYPDPNHSTGWDVGCHNSECSVEPNVWDKSHSEAIAAWNTRAAPVVTDQMVEAAWRVFAIEGEGWNITRLRAALTAALAAHK